MALRKLQGLKVGRLIVLILLFLIPASFILIVVGSELGWFGPIISWQMFTSLGPLPFLPEGWAKFIVWFGVPVFFSIPWVSFLLIDKDRVGETFDNMGRALRKVSIGLNLFYTVNALFIFAFFILPFGSPAIAVFASFGLIPWLVRKKAGARIPWWIAIIPGIILGAIPVILAIGFYANYAPVWSSIWTSWAGGAATGTLMERYGWVHVLYGFGYSLAIGAVIAGFTSFIFEGASQVDRHSTRPKGILYIVEFLVAAGVFILYMLLDVENPARNIVFWIISGVSIALGLLEFLLRWFKKTKRTDKDNVPMGAYIMLPLFIAVDFIRGGNVEQIKNYALTIALALACVIYFVLFILAYSFAGETYQSRWSKSSDNGDDEEEDSSDDE
ncbi:MAG TPA: hypothetical protein VMX55_12880 [candidate division Zixibacteria bacterium]|nr:hypothetical protein [candidate division Zixibacteria bacterium]